MKCEICKSDTRDIWVPGESLPDLTTIKVGNWITLKQCPSCNQLWVESPYEPYASFIYRIKWPRNSSDWSRIHDGDNGQTLCDWMTNEIKVLYRSAPKEIKDEINKHEKRSYGHYGLTKFTMKNPIRIMTI